MFCVNFLYVWNQTNSNNPIQANQSRFSWLSLVNMHVVFGCYQRCGHVFNLTSIMGRWGLLLLLLLLIWIFSLVDMHIIFRPYQSCGHVVDFALANNLLVVVVPCCCWWWRWGLLLLLTRFTFQIAKGRQSWRHRCRDCSLRY